MVYNNKPIAGTESLPGFDDAAAESRYGGRLYDVSAFRFIGRTSLSGYLKKYPDAEGMVHRLDSLLFDESIETPGLRAEQLPVMSRGTAIHRGQMLAEVAASREGLRLNEPLLHRASAFGIVPTLFRIATEFGSTGKFYRAIGSAESHRPSAFDDMTSEDMLKYLKSFAAETGKRPTWDGLHEASRNDSKRPSTNVILHRFGTRHLGAVLELIGYPDVRNWSEDDYYRWGVRYMEANRGELPTAADISFLSKLDRGPSARVIMNKFGDLRSYQEGVATKYWQQEADRKARRQTRLEHIAREVESGTVPKAIFDDVVHENELILRHSRFLLADELLDENYPDSKIAIACYSGKSVQARGLVNALKKVDPTLTAGDIESTAVFLGIFDDLWPLNDYLTRLRILKVVQKNKIYRMAYDRAVSPLFKQQPQNNQNTSEPEKTGEETEDLQLAA